MLQLIRDVKWSLQRVWNKVWEIQVRALAVCMHWDFQTITWVGLSQMELLGKRFAAAATKFQCVVRWYVRIVIKLCSNFYSLFENVPKKFCKRPIAYWTWTVVSSLFFSSVYFFSFFWKICVRSAQGGTPLDPVFLFPFFVFFCFPSLSSHIFSAFVPFCSLPFIEFSVLWLFRGRSFWCTSSNMYSQKRGKYA